jgi:hypothetical protein
VAASDYVTVGQLQNGGGGLGSGFLPLSGGVLTGVLTVGGTGIDYAGYYAGHNIAFGWDGSHLQAYVDNSAFGPVVFSNFPGNITAAGYTITAAQLTSTGNVNATGTVQAAQLTSTGNVNASGSVAASANVSAGSTVTAAQLTSTGNLNVSGSGAVSGGLNVGSLTSAGNIQVNGGTVYVGSNYMQDQGSQIYHDTNMSMGGGTYYKPGGGGFQAPSDIRVKKDVVAYTHGLAEILRLEPVEFAYNGHGGIKEDGRRWVGLNANDVAGVMPEMVLPWRRGLAPGEERGPDEDDLLGLDASALTYALLNAVKELSARLAALEERG